MSQLLPWLQTGQPVLVVGPEGCGRSMLLRACFDTLKSISIATVHCSAQTTARHVKQKLAQACGVFNTATGRVMRPKEGDRLILYLKDINLPTPDKYDTMQLIAFLQQLITHRGFFDDSLEWIGVERVQVRCCCSLLLCVWRLLTVFMFSFDGVFLLCVTHDVFNLFIGLYVCLSVCRLSPQ